MTTKREMKIMNTYLVEGIAVYFNPAFEEDREHFLCRTVKAESEEDAYQKHKLNIKWEFPFGEKYKIKEIKILGCELVSSEEV